MFKSGTSTFLDKLNKYEELGRKPKDTLVVADSRELAEEIKQNLIDEADLAGHNNTGTMENSFSVRPAGGGEYEVKVVSVSAVIIVAPNCVVDVSIIARINTLVNRRVIPYILRHLVPSSGPGTSCRVCRPAV